MFTLKHTIVAVASLLVAVTSMAAAFSDSTSQAPAAQRDSKAQCDSKAQAGRKAQCASGAECATAKLQTVDVRFQQDRAYELVFFTVAEGKEAQLYEQYLPAAGPYMKKHGAKLLGMFNVTESRSEALSAKMVAIFEWPNAAAKVALQSDAGFKEVAKLREGVFSFFKGGWFSAPKDTVVTFRSDKVYEIGGGSLFPTDAAKASLDTYFKVSGPIKKSYGGVPPVFVLNLRPSSTDSASTYTNDLQFIVEWDSMDDNAKLFADPEFKARAEPLLAAALKRTDFVFTTFVFKK